jgi:Zn-dependent M16 (insulinase) family peptidase
MDAAFFPNLRELDFKQEGWRLEHDNPNGMKEEEKQSNNSNCSTRITIGR